MPQRVAHGDRERPQAAGAGREDERLLQRVVERLPQHLQQQRGRRESEGEGGENERSQVAAVEDRQRPQPHGEHEHQHEAQPEHRGRREHQLDARRDRTRQATAGGQHSAHERDHDREHDRGEREGHRRSGLGGEQRRDRLLLHVRHAQVTAHEAAQVEEVLHDQRLVEVILGPHDGEHLRADVDLLLPRSQNGERRIDRHEPQREERQGRRPPQGDEAHAETAQHPPDGEAHDVLLRVGRAGRHNFGVLG